MEVPPSASASGGIRGRNCCCAALPPAPRSALPTGLVIRVAHGEDSDRAVALRIQNLVIIVGVAGIAPAVEDRSSASNSCGS